MAMIGLRSLAKFAVAPALAVLAGLTLSFGGVRTPFSGSADVTPPGEPVLASFSVARGDPVTAVGFHPADILVAGPMIAIGCPNLGLICTDPTTGDTDDVSSLAYDIDFVPVDLPPFGFSVTTGAAGLATTAVAVEAACSPAEAGADIFETVLLGGNVQDVDGNGAACGTGAGQGIGMDESAPGLDDVDALERDPGRYADLDGNGVPELPVFFTLASGSPSLALYGAGPADILVTAGGNDPYIYATATVLGLSAGDAIDGLCLADNSDGLYGAGDRVLFSLAPGSPTLAVMSAGAGDVIGPRPTGPVVRYQESTLGLATTDDVDGLVCPANDQDFDRIFDPPDNCPDWPNFSQGLPNWPPALTDSDCDGWKKSAEQYLGTDPARQCAVDATANNEVVDAWPTDFNDSRVTSLADVILMGPVYNQPVGTDPAKKRFDLNASGSVNLSDVILMGPFYNKGCS